MFGYMPQGLKRVFTADTPLGPVDGSSTRDNEVTAFILQLENGAFANIVSRASLLLGRRGAGKSALLKSFAAAKEITQFANEFGIDADAAVRRLFQDRNDFTKTHDIILWLDKPDEADAVVREISTAVLFTPEHAARIWSKRLWMHVGARIAQTPHCTARLHPNDQRVFKLIERAGIFSRRHVHDVQGLCKLAEEHGGIDDFVALTKRCVEEAGLSVLVLIDSMEEYNISQPAMQKAIGGLLQLMSTVAAESNGLHLKVTLPSEIYAQVSSEANPEKYFIQMETLRWRPVELARIVTHRYLTCLHLMEEPSFNAFWSGQGSRLLRERRRLFQMWEQAFDGPVRNEVDLEENALYLMLRHTQLLPRQLINVAQCIVKGSHRAAGVYGKLRREILHEELARSADNITRGIFSGYKYVYPKLLDTWRAFVPRCAVEMRYGELHSIFNKSAIRSTGLSYCLEFPEFLQMLVDVGVFGVKTGDTDRYALGRFNYNASMDTMVHEQMSFVMHPVFSSRYLEPERRKEYGRAVLPLGTFEGIDDPVGNEFAA